MNRILRVGNNNQNQAQQGSTVPANLPQTNQPQNQTTVTTPHYPTAIETFFLGRNATRTNARSDDELIATVSLCSKTDRATLKGNDCWTI